MFTSNPLKTVEGRKLFYHLCVPLSTTQRVGVNLRANCIGNYGLAASSSEALSMISLRIWISMSLLSGPLTAQVMM